MKAVGKYLIIENITEELKSNSGLIMTGEDMSNLRYRKSKVVSAGTEVDCVKDGDIIYHDSRAGHKVKLDDKVYGVILEREVVIKM
jgi:co-chaperonin GroES (HSP10)